MSTLEALAVTLVCYPSVAASVPGGVRRRATVEMVPGIEPCKDGFVGLTTLTAQQWHDFLAMIDRPDLIGNAKLDSTRARVVARMSCAPSSTGGLSSARLQRSSNGQPCSACPRRQSSMALRCRNSSRLSIADSSPATPAAGSRTRARRSSAPQPSLARWLPLRAWVSMRRRPSVRVARRRREVGREVVLAKTDAYRSKVSGFWISPRSGPVHARPSTSPPSART